MISKSQQWGARASGKTRDEILRRAMNAACTTISVGMAEGLQGGNTSPTCVAWSA